MRLSSFADLVATSTWLQKCVIMVVLQRLLRGVESKKIVKFYWISLGVSFIVIFVVNFTDCNPFVNYYRLIPNPGMKVLNISIV